MKTSKLISILQELDPTGQCEVTIDNNDINFADIYPGYYDGCFQIIEYCDDGKEIEGIKLCSRQDKIRLHHSGYEELFWDFPNLKITFDSEYTERLKDSIETLRKEIIKECEEIDSGKYDPKICTRCNGTGTIQIRELGNYCPTIKPCPECNNV